MMAIVNSGNDIWYSAELRSIGTVIDTYSCSRTAAEAYIVSGLLSLVDDDFYECNLCFGFYKCDVYVKVINGIPWYIKFGLEDEEGNEVLNQVSFHPLEKEAKLQNGEVIYPLEEK